MGIDLEELAGHELTSALLEEMRRRARGVTPAHVAGRMSDDRFSRIPDVDPAVLRWVETTLAAHWPAETRELELSPVVPFGAHASVAGVDQNRVVSTVRGSELAADPTVVLAIEAARLRSLALRTDPKSADVVSLGAFQRVVRAQLFEGDMTFAHFVLSGLVTAGRDTGGRSFERTAVVSHIRSIADGLLSLGCAAVEVRVTDFGGAACGEVIEHAVGAGWQPAVTVVAFPERTRAQEYYTDLAIEVHAEVDGRWVEIGDGGTVDWTQRLVGSRKERAMTSGLSVERLALLLSG